MHHCQAPIEFVNDIYTLMRQLQSTELPHFVQRLGQKLIKLNYAEDQKIQKNDREGSTPADLCLYSPVGTEE